VSHTTTEEKCGMDFSPQRVATVEIAILSKSILNVENNLNLSRFSLH
jgi:hypothetical protein